MTLLRVPAGRRLDQNCNELRSPDQRPSPPAPPGAAGPGGSAPAAFAARPYQIELLEKAKKDNIIVYLGTGSGKTYIAVMLIKEFRAQLAQGKKVIFLANAVELVEQQAEVIRNSTGLKTASYCGADGVDDWGKEKWKKEIQANSVMVFIHQVFLDVLSHGRICMSALALVVVDECHHATRNHPYAKIMRDWYHPAKQEGKIVPKILGLSASIVVKTVDRYKFRTEKATLEKMMDAKVETCDGISLQLFVNSAKEELVSYAATLPSSLQNDIGNSIADGRLKLMKVKIAELNSIHDSDLNLNTKATRADSLEKDCKFFSNHLLLSVSNLLELGVYSLNSMKESLCDELEKKKTLDTSWYRKAIKEEFVSITKHTFTEVFEASRKAMEKFSEQESDKILQYSSPKVLKLIEILKSYESTSEGASNELCSMRCIVFVQTKMVAKALQYLLWKLKLKTITDVGFVHSASVGRNVKDPREREDVRGQKRRMTETLRQFRAGKVNVLCSTSVVEEGIDVPSCNLVIKFDFPSTFRSYIQSKGRARAAGSRYLLLLPAGDKSLAARYQEWLGVYEMSVSECHNGQQEEGGPELEDTEEEFCSAGAARLSGTQAVVLLQQYLQKIPVDRFTKLTPVWSLTRVEARQDNQARLWAGLGYPAGQVCLGPGYRATVQLPHKTPLHLPVSGAVKPSKVAARRSAAIAVVRLLHTKGELDESLKIKKKVKVWEEMSEDEEEDEVTGVPRRAKFFRQRRPPLLRGQVSNSQENFLHEVTMELVEPLASARYRLYRPERDRHQLGLLAPAPLPACTNINLYSPSGLVKASCRPCYTPAQSLTFSPAQVAAASAFHRWICGAVLQETEQQEEEGGLPCPLLLPLLAGKVDWQLCRKVERAAAHPTALTRLRIQVLTEQGKQQESFYQDLVVFQADQLSSAGPADYFFIEEILQDLTAETPLAGLGTGKQSFSEMWAGRGRPLRLPGQPLVRIASAGRQLCMLRPGGEPQADGKPRTFRSYLVPELLAVAPLPAGLWRQAQMLPYLLHRLQSLLAALPHCTTTPRLPLSLAGMQENPDQAAQLQFLLQERLPAGERVGSPQPGQLVQALTLTAAGDPWDMERLEILGDSFLKFSTTIFLFYRMVETCDEGDLSLARSRIVGNRNLRLISEQLGLAECGIQSENLHTLEKWAPPGYHSLRLPMAGGPALSVEELLVQLDVGFGRHVGELRRWLGRPDLARVVAGELTGPGLLALARERRKAETPPPHPVRLRDWRLVPDKAQADCVEAMIGSYLYHCGVESCLQFMAGIGLDLGADSGVEVVLGRRQRLRPEPLASHIPLRDAFVNENAGAEKEKFRSELAKLGVEEIEETIDYKFKEKSFLLEAFTHPSYEDNRLTHSYERLEFLGDALLDYIVTCFIYTHSEADPGRLTDIRSALVCNNMFAKLLTDCKLDKYIRYSNPLIFTKIGQYLNDLWWQDCKPDETVKQYNEEDVPELEMVEVPKVLGDVFESIIGAIYIDSGHDLNVVWRVYRRLCPDLEEIVRNPPLNLKKQLLEKFPDKVVFSKVEEVGGRLLVWVEVSLADGNTRRFKGRGTSKHTATLAACKCALRALG